MGDYATMAATIRQRLIDEVQTPEGIGVLVTDNMSIDPPDTGTWLQLEVLFGDAARNEIGPDYTERTPGIAVVKVFVDHDTGDNAALDLADTIRGKFRSVVDGGVTFETPSVVRIGRQEKFYQVNVSCPFYFDGVVSN